MSLRILGGRVILPIGASWASGKEGMPWQYRANFAKVSAMRCENERKENRQRRASEKTTIFAQNCPNGGRIRQQEGCHESIRPLRGAHAGEIKIAAQVWLIAMGLMVVILRSWKIPNTSSFSFMDRLNDMQLEVMILASD